MHSAALNSTVNAPLIWRQPVSAKLFKPQLHFPKFSPLYNIYWPRYSTLKHIPIFSPFTMYIGHIPTTSSNSPPVQSLCMGLCQGTPCSFYWNTLKPLTFLSGEPKLSREKGQEFLIPCAWEWSMLVEQDNHWV